MRQKNPVQRMVQNFIFRPFHIRFFSLHYMRFKKLRWKYEKYFPLCLIAFDQSVVKVAKVARSNCFDLGQRIFCIRGPSQSEFYPRIKRFHNLQDLQFESTKLVSISGIPGSDELEIFQADRSLSVMLEQIFRIFLWLQLQIPLMDGHRETPLYYLSNTSQISFRDSSIQDDFMDANQCQKIAIYVIST